MGAGPHLRAEFCHRQDLGPGGSVNAVFEQQHLANLQGAGISQLRVQLQQFRPVPGLIQKTRRDTPQGVARLYRIERRCRGVIGSSKTRLEGNQNQQENNLSERHPHDPAHVARNATPGRARAEVPDTGTFAASESVRIGLHSNRVLCNPL